MRTHAIVLAVVAVMLAHSAGAQDLERTAIGVTMNQPNGYTFNGTFVLDEQGTLWSYDLLAPNQFQWVWHGGAQAVNQGLA
jgi:lipopolysaccharide export system protein LptC